MTHKRQSKKWRKQSSFIKKRGRRRKVLLKPNEYVKGNISPISSLPSSSGYQTISPIPFVENIPLFNTLSSSNLHTPTVDSSITPRRLKSQKPDNLLTSNSSRNILKNLPRTSSSTNSQNSPFHSSSIGQRKSRSSSSSSQKSLPLCSKKCRSRSPNFAKRRSPSSARRRSPSPARRRSPSPARRRSRSPARKNSPARKRSPSPTRKNTSPIRKSSSARRLSSSPARRRSRSPARRHSRSPARKNSPARKRSPSPIRKNTSSIRKSSPARKRSPSLVRKNSPSPVRQNLRNSLSKPINNSSKRRNRSNNRSLCEPFNLFSNPVANLPSVRNSNRNNHSSSNSSVENLKDRRRPMKGRSGLRDRSRRRDRSGQRERRGRRGISPIRNPKYAIRNPYLTKINDHLLKYNDRDHKVFFEQEDQKFRSNKIPNKVCSLMLSHCNKRHPIRRDFKKKDTIIKFSKKQ